MKLSRITVMVRDIDKTVMFYRELAGLTVIQRFNPGRGEIAIMADSSGDTALEFAQIIEAEKVQARGLTLSFQVRGPLEAVRDKAVELGWSPSEIIRRPPRPAHFVIADPDGVRVVFSR